ncbi:PREDICTED: uncharacterized protein LOC108764014 [Trachymyrmex cornetzi]|uniref:uncharacterized protein LOC108764014 n=1 Tax=Trachymyrmex cornetzi TaxID=471704 RepID=UPI00084F805B|nr:PREDICTED: uncharacterized protein LOC108764014 [Trachymyrmex cornetzi]
MLNKSCANNTIGRCCTSRDTQHVPPEHRKFRRVHGLQLPLHPQQIVGWVLLIVVFVGTFTVLLTTPPLLPDLRFVLSLLFAALFLLHVSTHLTVLLLDPADPEVRARPVRVIVPEFDRAKHRHVIENGRCHLCNITTRGRRTKHCSICNKCVPRFDHHCKWLNNCIDHRNTSMNNATATPPLLPMPGTGSLVLVTVIGVLSAIAAVMLIHLCFFHGYIACLGLTTYEYVRNKRERGTAVADSRTTSTSGLCGIPYCTAADEDHINRTVPGGRGLYSRFCENGPLRKTNTTSTTRMTMATTDVYVCSTHEETRSDEATANVKDVFSKTRDGLPSMRGGRNFRLCFSYDSRTTETSIQVSSSQTTDAMELRNHVRDSPDAKSSSTPSPVSCCFSIMNHPDGSRHDGNGRKRRTGDNRIEPTKRSCGTMRRIQTFLQARLRKGSRQRLTTSSSAIARHCGNKIIPQPGSPPDIALALTEHQDRNVEALTTELTTPPDYSRPPARLPALDFSRTVRKIRKVPSNTTDISVLGQTPPSTVSKRNQTHLRTRRSGSFSKKRPHFKIGSHVVTQTAQLSPIPESELSKPATPRSPSRSNSIFAFPPLHE